MNVLDYLEDELLSCLCSMLRIEGRPPCECHHFGGEDPPVGDRCQQNSAGENGQAWVRRVLQTTESDGDDIAFDGLVCSGAWRAQIELGVYRCISATPAIDGSAPSPGAYDADRDLLAADRATLARVLCCWPLSGAPPEPVAFDLALSLIGAQIAPTGPTGGCAGSIMTITVESGSLVVEEATEPVGFVGFVSRPAGGA